LYPATGAAQVLLLLSLHAQLTNHLLLSEMNIKKALRSILALITGLGLTSTISAQSASGSALPENRFSPSLVKWLDPVNPGFDLALERLTGSRSSIQINIGIMTDAIGVTPFEKYKGLGGGIERKFFKPVKKKHIYPYYALSLGYFHVNYDDESRYSLNNANAYLDTFSIDKTVYSLCGKTGWQIHSKRFFIDLSMGFGFKYKSTQKTGVNDPAAMELKPIDPSVYYMASKAGKYVQPTIPLNLRFGVMF
jgi:hypothetical protein